MKPAIRLSSFYYIIQEQRKGDDLIVTGIIKPLKEVRDPLSEAIVARFRIDRTIQREYWESLDYDKRG